MSGRWEQGETWIDAEEEAYTTADGNHWGSHRRGRVRLPDGTARIVTIGVPDTFFSIPGHDCEGREGFVSMRDDEFIWTYDAPQGIGPDHKF